MSKEEIVSKGFFDVPVLESILTSNVCSISESVREVLAEIDHSAMYLNGFVKCKYLAEVFSQVLKDECLRSSALEELDSGAPIMGRAVNITDMEASVCYDYAGTGDPVIADLYAQKAALGAQIKERELMLRKLPASGMEVSVKVGEQVDTSTGEVLNITKSVHVTAPTKQFTRTLRVSLPK